MATVLAPRRPDNTGQAPRHTSRPGAPAGTSAMSSGPTSPSGGAPPSLPRPTGTAGSSVASGRSGSAGEVPVGGAGAGDLVVALAESAAEREALLAELAAEADAEARASDKQAREHQSATGAAREAMLRIRELEEEARMKDDAIAQLRREAAESAAHSRASVTADEASAMRVELEHLRTANAKLQEDLQVESVACKSATESLREKEKECAGLRAQVTQLDRDRKRAVSDAVASADKLRAVTKASASRGSDKPPASAASTASGAMGYISDSSPLAQFGGSGSGRVVGPGSAGSVPSDYGGANEAAARRPSGGPARPMPGGPGLEFNHVPAGGKVMKVGRSGKKWGAD